MNINVVTSPLVYNACRTMTSSMFSAIASWEEPLSLPICVNSWNRPLMKRRNPQKALKGSVLQSLKLSFSNPLCLHHSDPFLVKMNHPCSDLRCVQGLERASETLEKEYEACEQVKLDVGALKSSKDLAQHERQEFLNLGMNLSAFIVREIHVL